MIASSTTSPSAMIRPGDAPSCRACRRGSASTSAAASSDSGIAVRLMTAVRQSHRNSDQHEDDQHAADQQRAIQVGERHLDERRRPEDGGVDVDAGKRRLQRGERRLDVARHLQRVALGLLLDDQQQARAVVDDAVADRRREALDDVGDVAQAAHGAGVAGAVLPGRAAAAAPSRRDRPPSSPAARGPRPGAGWAFR